MLAAGGKAMTPLLLASGSPRRRELLQLLGLPFRVALPSGEETTAPSGDARQRASDLACTKALSLAGANAEELIVAADTLVVLEGYVLGKPEDGASARRVLRALCARQHQVITGLAILPPSTDAPAVQVIETQVWMRQYGDDEIVAYIARGEPFDKAGSYAIQDPFFRPVERIQGCYANVMGLPLCHLFCALERAGVNVPAALPQVCQTYTGHRCVVAEAILTSGNR
jgi:septum formation protein